MAPKESPVAVITPSMRAIKLYADGRIEYQGKSGSVVGATARVEKSGEKHKLRDTRKVMLRIEGPRVAIAAPLPAAAFRLHKLAEEFVEKVNQMSNGGDGSARPPAARSVPDPPKPIDFLYQVDSSAPAASGAETDLASMDILIGQLERLGNLRDSGVLTEEEFQEQKTALLGARRNS
jgi:Short C-terminal domain